MAFQMTKRIDYTLVVEGIAEDYVIPRLLNQLGAKYELQFVRSSLSLKKSSAKGKSKVLSSFTEMAKETFVVQKHHLFIVGIDLDEQDPSGEQFVQELDRLENQLKNAVKDHSKKCIVFIAVQAFDYWLAYQKDSNIRSNSLEGKSKKEVKRMIYGKTLNKVGMERNCRKIISNWDTESLRKQSKSYADFHKKLENFMRNVEGA